VAAVVPEGDGVVSVHLTGRALHRLPIEAGQFAIWRFLGRPGWTRANPYSLSAAPSANGLRITVKDLGDGSRSLRALPPGTPVLFEGPHGRLSARARTRRKVTLIGAGVGITPLRALAEGLDYAPGEAVLLYRFTGRPLFGSEFEALARDRGLRILGLGGPRRSAQSWLGDIGPADDLSALRFWVPDLAEHDVFVCGPPAWTAAVLNTVRAAGVPDEQIHVESFRW
jgi:ferredoxin-NADP reductase